MQITLECQTGHDPFSPMAFTANWRDETYRYHVWIGLRPDLDGERVPYPVRISETIYKNTIADSRTANTIRKDINAAINAKTRNEIKRVATYDVLMTLYTEHRAAIDAFDAMHREANRLNRIFDAWKVIQASDERDLTAVGILK